MKKLFILALTTVLSFNACAGTAFFQYEQVSGMNKICYYSYLGSTYTLNIKSVSICPMTINV